MRFKHVRNGIAFGGIWQITIIALMNQTYLFGDVNYAIHVIQERALFLEHLLLYLHLLFGDNW